MTKTNIFIFTTEFTASGQQVNHKWCLTSQQSVLSPPVRILYSWWITVTTNITNLRMHTITRQFSCLFFFYWQLGRHPSVGFCWRQKWEMLTATYIYHFNHLLLNHNVIYIPYQPMWNTEWTWIKSKQYERGQQQSGTAVANLLIKYS